MRNNIYLLKFQVKLIGTLLSVGDERDEPNNNEETNKHKANIRETRVLQILLCIDILMQRAMFQRPA